MKLRLIAILGWAALSAWACGKPDAPVTPSVRIDGQNTLNMPEEGGSQTFTISASLSWTAACNVDWIKVDPNVGKGGDKQSVTVTVQQNLGAERSGAVTFTISGTSTSAELKVVQAATSIIQDDDPPVVTGETVLSVDFTKGMGEFVVEDKDKGGFPGEIWATNSSHPEYGVVAQAYVSATGKRYKTESWLVSPRINLKGHEQLYLRFRHALNYANDEAVTNFIGVRISADKGESWSSVSIPNLPRGNSFEFLSSGDIDLKAYKDKVIQLAFVYKSTSTTTPTWEITQLRITEEEEVITKDDFGDEYKGVPKWMELPAVSDEENYFIHTAPIGEVNYRNYSFLYDSENLVALWVAYPLCDLYTKKTVSRTDKWAYDPFVAEDAQPAFFRAGNIYDDGKGGVKYNRGHQLPSADRLASTKMNEQTFYFTNIAPQMADKAFNAGPWEDLEIAVRGWSAASNGTDTLYVVTGCMVDNPIEYRTDNNGKKVSIPNAFFKVLLRLSKGSYIGSAFYMDHKDYQGQPAKLKDFAMPVKDLEAKTGLSFFANLPEETAAKVKAEDPTTNAFWGL